MMALPSLSNSGGYSPQPQYAMMLAKVNKVDASCSVTVSVQCVPTGLVLCSVIYPRDWMSSIRLLKVHCRRN